jgi:hypothetical protein
MNMPEFTAEASLRQTARRYRMAATHEAATTLLYPQRATGPFGPIGLPGQDCHGACSHVCMMATGGHFGPFFDKCMDSCASTCTGLSYTARL